MIQILIGVVAGIFSGIGMGGGTILIFLLTTFGGLEQHIAQATNMIYFIPTAISAIIVNYKNKYKIGTFYICFWCTWSDNWCKYFCTYRCTKIKKIVWHIFISNCNS